MKLTVLLVCISAIASFANVGYAQSAKLTVVMENATVQSILHEIENQSEFRFFFSGEVDVERTTSINMVESKVFDILDELFKDTEVAYRVYDRQIALIDESDTFDNNSVASQMNAGDQQPAVSGKVTDFAGQALPGVTVVVKGTSQGTVTNDDGEYTFTDLPDDATLVFSFVGMRTQEVEVDDQTSINVTMEEETIGLEEVVAVGYGTQRKVNITGSVGSVTSEQLEDKPVATVGHALQGVIPNLNIEVPSGRPGTNPTFNIRGYESITGGNPLILVDGIPRSINDVNPNDIESISVLKDASAAAVYGARGAFGVILVETKRAKEQDLQVNLHARFSGEVPIFKMDMVTDPYLHMTMANQAMQRSRGTDAYPQFRVEAARKWSENPTPENAWHVEEGHLYWVGGGEETLFPNRFFRDVIPKFDYNVDVQGGTEKAKYYASVGWVEEPGIFKPEHKGEKHERLNADLRVELNVYDWLTLTEKVSYTNNKQDEPHYYTNQAEWNMLQRFGVSYYTGGFPSTDHFDVPDYPGRDYSEYEGMYIGSNHPIPYFERGGRDLDDIHDTYLTQGIKIDPIDNLIFRGDFTYRHYDRRRENVRSRIDKLNGIYNGTIDLLQDEMITAGYSSPTFIENQYNQNHYYFLNATGEYEFDNTDSPHYFKAMVGFNQEWNTNRYGYLQGYDMITPEIQSIRATSGDQNVDSREAHLAIRGAFSRLNYNYNNRYLIELSGRYDGTSRFPTDDRFGLFPSGSVGWRISEENFMSGLDLLDNLMLKASYGELGNQGVGGYYPYLSTMNMGISNYLMEGNRIPYVNSPGLVSPSLTWEKTRTTNFGINLSLFEQKLTFEFDSYTRETLDMLMRIDYPNLLGTSAPQENGADLANRGWELNTTYMGRTGSDLAYNLTFTLADNKTEITKYDANPTGNVNDYYEGKIIGEIWGYETVGIFQTEEEVANAADQSHIASLWRPGDIQYADLNEDGEINPGNNTLDDPGDRRIIGNSSPRYTYGLNLDATYKNFSLTIFFQGVGKRDWYPNRGNHSLFWPFNAQGIQQYMIDESWSEDNRDAYFYAPTRLDGRNNEVQTRYLQDASYLRLKDVSLRYEIPTSGTLETIGLRRLQVYVTGRNLAEFTDMHDAYDPEYLYTNVAYPLSRSFSLGVRVGF